jgi:hypothetical protein
LARTLTAIQVGTLTGAGAALEAPALSDSDG